MGFCLWLLETQTRHGLRKQLILQPRRMDAALF